MSDRSNEFDIALGVMRYLKLLPTSRASISVIKGRLPKYASLTEEDRLPSPTRKGEMVWEQQVRNLVSHRRMRGNAIYDGYLSYEGRGILSLTDAGRNFIRHWDEQEQVSQKKPGC
jgi:hypothetical protein